MIPYLTNSIHAWAENVSRKKNIPHIWLALSVPIFILSMALVLKTVNLYTENNEIIAGAVTDYPYNRIQYKAKPKFPLIIHQTWRNYKIPREFIPWVHSWHKYNPDWEYWFWSRAEIDALIRAKYPEYKEMLDKYDQGIRRADAIRYMILHEIGGFYADLDMECLQPLRELADMYSCFLSEENYEHVNLIYHKKDPIVINCVMGCRPGHPFYKDAVREIAGTSGVVDVLKGTGPIFFTSIYQEYQKKASVSLEDHIVLLPPRYLLPIRDQRAMLQGKEKVRNLLANHSKIGDSLNYVPPFVYKPSLDKDQIDREVEICHAVTNMNFAVPKHPEALTTHHWAHTWDVTLKKWWVKRPTIHIKKLVSNIKLYSNILNGKQKSIYYNPL